MEKLDARPGPPSDARRSASWLVVLAIVGGLGFDVGLRGGVANGVVAAALTTVAVTVLVGSGTRTRPARVMAMVAILPAWLLAVRASPWLAWSNGIASVALLGSAICYSRSGSVLDTNLSAVMRRSTAAIARGCRGRALLRPLVLRLVDSVGSEVVELRRSQMAIDWLARVQAPAWLDLVPSLVRTTATVRYAPRRSSVPFCERGTM